MIFLIFKLYNPYLKEPRMVSHNHFLAHLVLIILIPCPINTSYSLFILILVTVHTHSSKWMFLCISPKFIFSFCTTIFLGFFLSTSLPILPLLSSFHYRKLSEIFLAECNTSCRFFCRHFSIVSGSNPRNRNTLRYIFI